MKKLSIFNASLFLLFLLFSCDSQNPLYGRWSDNYGNTIMFNDEGNYKFVVTDGDEETSSTGKFIVDLNTIILTDDTNTDAAPILSEWDVRGNVLYLDYYTEESGVKTLHSLALYRTGNQKTL